MGEVEAGEVVGGMQEYTFSKAVGTKVGTGDQGERLAALKAAVEAETEGATDLRGKLARAFTRSGTQQRGSAWGGFVLRSLHEGGRASGSPRPAEQRHAGTAAMKALALPRIDLQVPRTIAPGPILAANAAVSYFLIEAKAFAEADIPAICSDSLSVCQQTLDHRLKRQIGPLHCLNPRFGLHMLSREGDYYGYFNSQQTKGLDFGAEDASWGEYHEQEWPVGEGLAALSRQIPGLGTVVLHVLRRQSAKVYPVFTPDIACDVSSYLYWCGEDDEETALDMNCGEDEREAMRAEMVDKATLEAAYQWAA